MNRSYSLFDESEGFAAAASQYDPKSEMGVCAERNAWHKKTVKMNRNRLIFENISKISNIRKNLVGKTACARAAGGTRKNGLNFDMILLGLLSVRGAEDADAPVQRMESADGMGLHSAQ